MNSYLRVVLVGITLCISVGLLPAETGREAWLGYAPITDTERAKYAALPASAVAVGDSELVRTAQKELVRGIRGMMGRTLRESAVLPQESTFVIGALDNIHALIPNLHPTSQLAADGYWLTTAKVKGHDVIVITAANDRGVLYGVFAFLSKIARNQVIYPPNEMHSLSRRSAG